jgi:mycofactocin biosynthetic radical S-adenosylmethionine protein MftC
MAAKFFAGLPLNGPDPECSQGHGQAALQQADPVVAPRPADDHSHRDPCEPGPPPGLRRQPARRLWF